MIKTVYFIACLLYGFLAQASTTLQELVVIAIDNHPQLRANKIAEKISQIDIEIAKDNYYPKLDINLKRVKPSSDDFSYNQDKTVIFANITQPLYAGGALDATLDAAKNNAKLLRIDGLYKMGLLNSKHFCQKLLKLVF